MQIEYNIASILRSIDREWEGNVIEMMLVSSFVLAFGVEYFLVVHESRWSDEHEAVFFDAGLGYISFHLVGAWSSGRIIVIHTEL